MVKREFEMMRTGMSKMQMAILIAIILGLVAVAIYVSLRLLPLPNIETVKKGEKHRFMRYLTCAAAACSKGYGSDVVNTLKVEFDEEGNPTKYCNQLIEDNFGVFPIDPPTRLCGQAYTFTFTFQDSIKYVADYSVTAETLGEVPCSWPVKSNWQTDISCYQRWEGSIFDCGCVDKCGCGTRPEGKLKIHTGGCGIGISLDGGTIWIPEDMVGNECKEGPLPNYYPNWGLTHCNFETGLEIDFWADRAGTCGECTWWGCWGGWPWAPLDHYCPQIAICPS